MEKHEFRKAESLIGLENYYRGQLTPTTYFYFESLQVS
jgi:hypothetical protein